MSLGIGFLQFHVYKSVPVGARVSVTLASKGEERKKLSRILLKTDCTEQQHAHKYS